MAKLYISEYKALPQVVGSGPPLMPEPAVATQVVSYTGTAGRSSAFNTRTRYIAITSDGIFSYKLGGSSVAATINEFRVQVGAIIFMSVPSGAFISAITNT